MATVKAILLKPLDGFAEGSIREFDQADFDRLVALHAIKAEPAPLVKPQPVSVNKAKA